MTHRNIAAAAGEFVFSLHEVNSFSSNYTELFELFGRHQSHCIHYVH